jgi:hypothetical protein
MTFRTSHWASLQIYLYGSGSRLCQSSSFTPEKIVEIVTKRLISTIADILTQSSRIIAGEIPERISSSCRPIDISFRLHRERLLCSEIYNLWNLNEV